ncbi:hypothetical protein E3P99_02288 [Wallemia hederae]|uniref:FYVE-type domain-containing protein n=1 Tax=Wallemia hederae TaxID=1540922 RepID=A0A4T0FLM7_9BASI|nr:hypothetical protein E3P99_02288 [Wallemia hederae]
MSLRSQSNNSSASSSNSVKGFVIDHNAVARVVHEKRSHSQPPKQSTLSPLVSRSNSPARPATAVKHKNTNTLRLDKLPQFSLHQANQSTPNLTTATDDDSWLSFIPNSSKQHQNHRANKAGINKGGSLPSTSSSVDFDAHTKSELPALLPKSLWKPDSDSAECDIVTCSTSFSLLERRHHCRKCGGIFCHPHSTQSAKLVDTAGCDYILPRRNGKNDKSRTVIGRVCDDCYQDLSSWDGLPSSTTGNFPKSLSSQSLSIDGSQSQLPRTPQLCISPTSSSTISSPSSSLQHQQHHINVQYTRMMTQQQQQNSYFVPPIITNVTQNQVTPPLHSASQTGPLHNYVLASTSARQAPGRIPAFTPPITPAQSTYTSSLNIPITKRKQQENVIVDGDIKIKEQPANSMGQSLAKSLTWAWSTF